MLKQILSALLFVSVAYGVGCSSGDSNNSKVLSTDDFINFLQQYRIESISDDYKTFYSDGTLGMPAGKMTMIFTGDKVKYEACSPVSYSVKSHQGGDDYSRNPYFTATFLPTCTRGDELVLTLYLNEKDEPDLLGLRSKIFDSYTALKGSGSANDRKMASGPSLRIHKR